MVRHDALGAASAHSWQEGERGDSRGLPAWRCGRSHEEAGALAEFHRCLRAHRGPLVTHGASLLESLMVVARVLPRLRRPTFRSLGLQSHGLCHACGTMAEFEVKEVFWPALVTEWRLTPAMKAAFDRRESGMCPVCRNNYRNRQLARALVDVYGRNGEVSVAELTRSEHFRSLRILGIDLDFLLMLEAVPRILALELHHIPDSRPRLARQWATLR